MSDAEGIRRTRRGRAVRTIAVAVAVVVLITAGWTLRDRVLEQFALRALDSASEEERLEALRRLAEVGGERAAAAVFAAIDPMGEPPPSLSSDCLYGPAWNDYCASTLLAIGNRTFPTLRDVLQNGTGLQRDWAAYLLKAVESDRALPVIWRALESPEESVRDAAAHALAHHGWNHPDVVDRIFGAFAETTVDDDFRKGCIYAACCIVMHSERLGTEKHARELGSRAIDAMEVLLLDPSPEIRVTTMAVLGWHGGLLETVGDLNVVYHEDGRWSYSPEWHARVERLIRAAILSLGSASADLRQTAVQFAFHQRDFAPSDWDPVALVEKLLSDADPEARRYAASVIGYVEGDFTQLTPRLVRGLMHPITSDECRSALEELGDPGVAALVGGLGSDDRRFRNACVKALQSFDELTPEQRRAIFGPLLDLIELDGLPVDETGWLLGACGHPENAGFDELARALDHAKSSVRAIAAIALSYYGERVAPLVPRLIELSRDPVAVVRGAALEALVDSKVARGDACYETLVRALEDPVSARARERAARGLAAFPERADDAVPRLLRALSTDGRGSWLAYCCMKTLKSFGPRAKQAVPVLRRLLTAADPVDDYAANALLGLDDRKALGRVFLEAFRETRDWQLIRYIGKLGPVARHLLPELEALRGDADLAARQWELDKVIDEIGATDSNGSRP